MVDESLQRGISAEFEQQFTSGEGILHPLLERVRHDDTLSLEIRNGYVSIYYRGGSLLRITADAMATTFSAFFERRYFGSDDDYRCQLPDSSPPTVIADAEDARAWVDAFAFYKQAMDIRFAKHTKIEREYQQAVVRDNNRHATGESSDYVVLDVEYAQSRLAFPEQNANYRFDMVGLRWPVAGTSRAKGIATPVIMEMKTGDGALASHALSGDPEQRMPGLVKHVRDIERFLTPEDGEELSGPYRLLRGELLRVLATKQRLELPSLPTRLRRREITELTARPEVVFVIANHQPRSTVLQRELAAAAAYCHHADYYVATVQHTGYALYAENMMPLGECVTGLD